VIESDSLLTRTTATLRRDFLALWLTSAWPYFLVGICFTLIGAVYRATHDPAIQISPLDLWQALGPLDKFGIDAAFLISVVVPRDLATAGVAMKVWAKLHGEPMDWPLFLSRFGRVLPRLLVLSLALGLVCSLAGFLFILPGIVLAVFTSFAIPVLVIQDTTISSALRTGFTLAKTQFGRLLLLWVITVLLGCAGLLGMIGAMALAPAWSDSLPRWMTGAAFWVGISIVASLCILIRATVTTHLYQDAVARRGETFVTPVQS